MFPSSDDPLLPTAIAAAAVTALIEFPISQYYATVPATDTKKRMLIAGGMAFVSVLIGGAALKYYKKAKG